MAGAENAIAKIMADAESEESEGQKRELWRRALEIVDRDVDMDIMDCLELRNRVAEALMEEQCLEEAEKVDDEMKYALLELPEPPENESIVQDMKRRQLKREMIPRSQAAVSSQSFTRLRTFPQTDAEKGGTLNTEQSGRYLSPMNPRQHASSVPELTFQGHSELEMRSKITPGDISEEPEAQ